MYVDTRTGHLAHVMYVDIRTGHLAHIMYVDIRIVIWRI